LILKKTLAKTIHAEMEALAIIGVGTIITVRALQIAPEVIVRIVKL
jgi:hypothetical protein